MESRPSFRESKNSLICNSDNMIQQFLIFINAFLVMFSECNNFVYTYALGMADLTTNHKFHEI